jgi:hypothetical protein
MLCHALDVWLICGAFLCDFHEGWSSILTSLFHWFEIKFISEASEYLT